MRPKTVLGVNTVGRESPHSTVPLLSGRCAGFGTYTTALSWETWDLGPNKTFHPLRNHFHLSHRSTHIFQSQVRGKLAHQFILPHLPASPSPTPEQGPDLVSGVRPLSPAPHLHFCLTGEDPEQSSFLLPSRAVLGFWSVCEGSWCYYPMSAYLP